MMEGLREGVKQTSIVKIGQKKPSRQDGGNARQEEHQPLLSTVFCIERKDKQGADEDVAIGLGRKEREG